MTTTIVFPILNKKFVSFKGPQWYLSDNLCIKNLQDEHYGAIARSDFNLIKENVRTGHKCVYWVCDDHTPTEKEIENKLSSVIFSLNTFLNDGAIYIPFGFISVTKIKTRIEKLVEFPYYGGVGSSGAGIVKIRGEISQIAIKETFKLADHALLKNPSCLLMVKRYNMSVLRADPLDQLIDIAISLEHIVTANTELTFRLCLIISLLVEDNPKKRDDIFDLFKSFYNARSVIVHGVSDIDNKKVQNIIKRMSDIKRYGAVAILYYFKFLEDNESNQWDLHCMGRILNSEESVLS